MKKGLMILVALSILLLMGASMLAAQEKMCAEKEKATCTKEMKLTAEQRAKVEELRTNIRLKMIDLKAEREKLGIALKQEMAKPEPAMTEIEGIVKKLSAVREKMQLAAIGQRFAMRKLLGSDAPMGCLSSMKEGRRMGRGHGMVCGGEEMDCRMMRMPGKRMGAACEMPGMCVMMKKGEGCCPSARGSWKHRMFRPFGRKEHGAMIGGCAMGMGAAGCCCGKGGMKGAMKCEMMGDMKGGCKMGKGASAGCSKKCVEKEIKCKAEIKEKEEPKE